MTIERLKALKLTKLTVSGRLFQTFITLLEKKFIQPLLHSGLYNLYVCPLVFDTVENSKKNQHSLTLLHRKLFYSSRLSRAVDDVTRDLGDQA